MDRILHQIRLFLSVIRQISDGTSFVRVTYLDVIVPFSGKCFVHEIRGQHKGFPEDVAVLVKGQGVEDVNLSMGEARFDPLLQQFHNILWRGHGYENDKSRYLEQI